MFKKVGTVESTISVHNPETGVTSFHCPKCSGMTDVAGSKQSFVKEASLQSRKCSKCGSDFNA